MNITANSEAPCRESGTPKKQGFLSRLIERLEREVIRKAGERQAKGGSRCSEGDAKAGGVLPFCVYDSIKILVLPFLIASLLINEYLGLLMAGQFGLTTMAAHVAGWLAVGILAGVV